jgi:uncharacterized small protein (DUF1192 family)
LSELQGRPLRAALAAGAGGKALHMGDGSRMGQAVIADEDEPKKLGKRLEPPPLDSWGQAELDAYAAELRGELQRVEAEALRKSHVRAAAAAFFRAP